MNEINQTNQNQMNETRIKLQYPRDKSSAKFAIVGLVDVRAADDIRISYDFDRDGWKIEQEQIVNDNGNYQCAGKWIESAFVPAYGQEKQINEQNETK